MIPFHDERVKRVFLLNFGSLGDLHPFIGMGLALKGAGYGVLVGTNPSHLPRVKEAGLDAIGVGPDLRPDDPELIRIVLDPRRGPERLHREYIFPSAEKGIEDALSHAQKSDLLLTGILGYFVLTLSELTKVPWGMGMLAPIGYWSAHDPPETPAVPFLRSMRFLGPSFLGAFYRALLSLGASWAKPLQEARKRRGLAPQSNPLLPSTATSGALNLALFSKHFAEPQRDWPKNLVQPGYIDYDGPGADADLSPEIESFLGAGEPPILVTLGSTHVMQPDQIFETFHEVVRPIGQRAIFLVGSQRLQEYRAKFREEQFGVFAYAPYGKLMPRCRAIVHQGGAGTTGRCLKSGAPAVILAGATDQLDNARHVEEIGAGVKLPLRALSVATLARALERVGAAETRARAAQIASLVRAENPEARVVEAVRSVIGSP